MQELLDQSEDAVRTSLSLVLWTVLMGHWARRFDENYALASTQNLKNKDIPEGGAKGTILPSCVLLLFFLLAT